MPQLRSSRPVRGCGLSGNRQSLNGAFKKRIMKSLIKSSIFVTVALSNALSVELPYRLGDLKTLDGGEYHDVTVTQKTAAGIAVTHDSGIGKFAWDKIPIETQLLLGYDVAAEAVARKQKEA